MVLYGIYFILLLFCIYLFFLLGFELWSLLLLTYCSCIPYLMDMVGFCKERANCSIQQKVLVKVHDVMHRVKH